MQYRKGSSGEALSLLGFGCMRFTRRAGAFDKKKAEEELMTAIRGGVNYLDTAYIYSGSEALVGEILEKNHCRDQVFLATKLPLFLIRSREGIERTFQEQLKRLRTDHIDYYLMHMLNDLPTWKKLCALGIEEWIAEKKASGQIRRIGFSYHGNQAAFREVVDAYPWDFCQIQYNYMDENSQAGRAGLLYAHEKGLHVVVMEPLRGGHLVNLLPPAAKKFIERYGGGRSAAEWAFRWLYNQPEVTTVLSGMNSLEMVEENLRIAGEVRPGEFTKRDHAFIAHIRNIINRGVKVGCTGCGYCMPCPKGVDIPGAFRCYNLAYSEKRASARMEYLRNTAMRREQSSASQCVGCGRCEKHCPQHIAIRSELKNVVKVLEGPVYKVAKRAIRLGKFY